MKNLCIQPELKFRYLGRIEFPVAYQIQMEIVEKKITNPYYPDFVLGLVHEPCFTIGREGKSSDILRPAFPVYKTDRGGRVTYHGPGQLVIYVVMNIKTLGLRRYVDFLEGNLVQLLINLGLDKNSIASNFKTRGVWVNNRKICSLGVGIKKWISYHGISINLDKRVDEGFRAIIPCGLQSEEISSLQEVYRAFSPCFVFYKFKELFNGSY